MPATADVWDELDQFVDSEPIDWLPRLPAPADARVPPADRVRPLDEGRQSEPPVDEPAPATFAKAAPKRDAFAERLSAELANPRNAAAPPQRPAPKPSATQGRAGASVSGSALGDVRRQSASLPQADAARSAPAAQKPTAPQPMPGASAGAAPRSDRETVPPPEAQGASTQQEPASKPEPAKLDARARFGEAFSKRPDTAATAAEPRSGRPGAAQPPAGVERADRPQTGTDRGAVRAPANRSEASRMADSVTPRSTPRAASNAIEPSKAAPAETNPLVSVRAEPPAPRARAIPAAPDLDDDAAAWLPDSGRAETKPSATVTPSADDAPENAALHAAAASAAPDDEPTDALEWELHNAISAIVSGGFGDAGSQQDAGRGRDGANAVSPAPEPVLSEPIEEPAAFEPFEDDAPHADSAAGGLGPDDHADHHGTHEAPATAPARAPVTATGEPDIDDAGALGDPIGDVATVPKSRGARAIIGRTLKIPGRLDDAPQPAPRRTTGPPEPDEAEPAPPRLGLTRAIASRLVKPIPTFRFDRRADDASEPFPTVPADVDDPLATVLFDDARDALRDVRGTDPDGAVADDDGVIAFDEFGDEGDDPELPESLSHEAYARPERRRGGRAVRIAAGVVGLGVAGLFGAIGLSLFSGEPSGAGADNTPRIIRADADDVKVRPEDTGPQAEPDIAERTRLGDSDRLVMPDSVPLDATRTPRTASPTEGLASRPVRTIVVRPDFTYVPADRDDAAASADGDDETADTADTRADADTTVRAARPAPDDGSSAGDDTADAGVAPFDMASADARDTASDASAYAPNFDDQPGFDPVDDIFDRDDAGDDAEADGASDAAGSGVAVPAPRPNPPPQRTSSRAGPQNLSATATATATTQRPRASAPAVASTPSAPWSVQVSSQRSRADAEASLRNLRARYPSILGDGEATIAAANVGSRGQFYRVRMLAQSRSEANAMCARLKAAGGDCFIASN